MSDTFDNGNPTPLSIPFSRSRSSYKGRDTEVVAMSSPNLRRYLRGSKMANWMGLRTTTISATGFKCKPPHLDRRFSMIPLVVNDQGKRGYWTNCNQTCAN